MMHIAMPTCPALFRFLFGVVVLFALTTIDSHAQTQTTTDGATPAGVKPGAPAGSYTLSDWEQINLFNGHLNFILPVVGVQGRGGARVSLPVRVSPPAWRVEHQRVEQAIFNATVIDDYYFATADWWNDYRPIVEGGTLIGRWAKADPIYCGEGNTFYARSNTRLTFTATDGTEYELLDQIRGGQPRVGSCFDPGNGFRGTIFTTIDGTSATFVSDQALGDQYSTDPTFDFDQFEPSGSLMLRDGTRYQIQGGKVTSLRDRNGNQLTFTREFISDPNSRLHKVRIKDSLNREAVVTYNNQDADRYVIEFPGHDGATRAVRIATTRLENVLRAGYQIKTYAQLFPELNSAQTFNPAQTISTVTLPDDRTYEFRYNDYGELARVKLPTGGAIEYDYEGGQSGGTASGVVGEYTLPRRNITTPPRIQIHRRLVERRVYPDGVTLQGRTKYGKPGSSGGEINIRVDHQDPSAGDAKLASEKHYFYGNPIESMLYHDPVSGGLDVLEGKEKQTDWLNTEVQSEPVLRSVTHDWQGITGVSGHTINPRIAETVTTIKDTNQVTKQVTKQTFGYDSYNNQTDVREYDYGAGAAPAHPTRHTHTDYLTTNTIDGTDYNYATDNSIHLRSLPTETKVYSVNTSTGTETVASRTTYEYDQTALDPAPDIINLDATFASTTHKQRGNVTSVTRYADAANSTGPVTSTMYYDVAGNVVKTTDAKGKSFEIAYDDAFTDNVNRNTYAFPTSTTSPVPDPSGASGSATALVTSSTYDYSTGQVVSATDANNQTTNYEYNDTLDRLTRVNAPDGGWTNYQYHDNARYVSTASNLDNTLNTTVDQYFDGLGRSVRTFQYDTQDAANPWLTVDTEYDALGRVRRVSNPYRSNGSPTPIPDPNKWTTTAYDALSRMVSVTTPDGAVVQSAYSGNAVTVTDQAGKKRRSITDALGRLTRVDEPNDDAGSLGAVDAPTQSTSYTYDALNNLRKVDQGAQQRYFYYDSLSRLFRARNPEQNVNTSLNLTDPVTSNIGWTTAYDYDGNGNLTWRKDARGAVTTYTYDNINRVITRSYTTAGTTAVTTPTVTYTYDKVTNARGRLTQVHSPVSTTNYSEFDALGRVTKSNQVTAGSTYPFTYAYDKQGNLKSQTYPSGRTVTTAINVAGRIESVGGARTYASEFRYTPHNAVEQLRLGNNLYENTVYNERLQAKELRLGTSNTNASVWKLENGYGIATTNNGNVLGQTLTVGATVFNQGYEYDELNRLKTAQENGGTSWKQTYKYDRFGNRQFDAAGTNTPAPLNAINNPAPDQANNRLEGQTYDLAGNVTVDTEGHTLSYDAENKLATYDGGAVTFTYDGDGRRVKKTSPYTSDIYVYNAEGQMAAEYRVGGSGPATAATTYLTADHLGSTRVVTNASGAVEQRQDYLPFGEEMAAGGGRSSIAGYGVFFDPRQKFTSYERDSDTGLDYAQSRYYSPAQGRFTSPDEFKGGPQELWVLGSGDSEKQALAYADVTNPQSLNKYQYTFNNPLRYIDQDGHAPQDGHEVRLRADERRLAKGEMTDQEFQARRMAEGIGATAGVAAVITGMAGPRIIAALLMWGARNPEKVQQIAQGTMEAAGGPPGLTLSPNSRLSPSEISTGARLAKQLGVRLEESAHVGAEYIVAGAKKTIDAMGTPDAYKYFGSGTGFFNSIVRHVNKSVDYVAIDLRGASQNQVRAIETFVSGLKEEQRNKIIYVR